jgi:alpha-mannosidase
MKPLELGVLLPCHSLEDFPQYHSGDDAEGLLAGWTVLWHPLLLAATEKLPRWWRADFPPDDCAGKLFVVPPLCERQLAAGWTQRVAGEGAKVVRQLTRRADVLTAVLAAFAEGADEAEPAADSSSVERPADAVQSGAASAVDSDLAADFLALGYAYLQIELLTRQMRYMSNLDELHLERQAVQAAQAALAGDADAAGQHLTACFEVLLEARERFYPVDLHLLDLTLVADTTLGASLRAELEQPSPVNLLMSGDVARQLAEREPETRRRLLDAQSNGRACVVGGEDVEGPLPLASHESIRETLRRGDALYRQHLGRGVRIFARRRFGLSPVLPLELARSGFLGCVHFTFDDGQFPQLSNSKTRWQGFDGNVINALGRLPLDAREPGSFLGFSQRLAESMDLDQVASLSIVHWPGQFSSWYDDLRRIGRYAPVFGKFTTLEEFFEHTDSPGRLSKTEPDEYRSAYLKQAVEGGEANPLSSSVVQAAEAAATATANTLSCLATLLMGRRVVPTPLAGEGSGVKGIESSADATSTVNSAARQLAKALGAKLDGPITGQLVLNPLTSARAAVVEVATPSGSQFVAVEVPTMGFAWASADAPAQPRGRRGATPIAEDHRLANDLVEISIDPQTGGVRTVRDFRTRGNRLSQQLAIRRPGRTESSPDQWDDPAGDAQYSQMVGEQVLVTVAGPAFGEIVSRGRLVDSSGAKLAGFEQRVRLPRGSRVAELRITLDLATDIAGDPWQNYAAARFAWADPEAELFRSVHGTAQRTRVRRLEAPQFVEIREERGRTAILTGGLVYHRRSGDRMLDTLLVVRGESRREWRLGLGVDLPNPTAAAVDLATPLVSVPAAAAPGGQISGWLFHLEAPHIIATHWEPLWGEPPHGDRVIGFRARLLDVQGKPGRVRLRTPRPVTTARQVDFVGQTLVMLVTSGDSAMVDFSAYEWVEIEVLWQLDF